MTEKKYIVMPGIVTSMNDRDRHFIGGERLVRLYGVKKEECYFSSERSGTRGLCGKFKLLKPRYDGRYNVEICEEVDL